jgi:hypothetical protein
MRLCIAVGVRSLSYLAFTFIALCGVALAGVRELVRTVPVQYSVLSSHERWKESVEKLPSELFPCRYQSKIVVL